MAMQAQGSAIPKESRDDQCGNRRPGLVGQDPGGVGRAQAGQIMIAAPMLGRPEVVASGQAGVVVAGPPDAVARCRPLFEAISRP
jgi:hypothetical protein